MFDDEILPGYHRVTEILGVFEKFPDLVKQEVLEKASDRGNRVHSACESKAIGIWTPEPAEDVLGYVISFENWLKKEVEEVIWTEKRLYDDKLLITGKGDMCVRLKSDPKHEIVIDLKTPKNMSKKWPLQVAAYCKMSHVRRGGILRLKADANKPIFTYYNEKEVSENFDLFMCAYKTFHHFKLWDKKTYVFEE